MPFIVMFTGFYKLLGQLTSPGDPTREQFEGKLFQYSKTCWDLSQDQRKIE